MPTSRSAALAVACLRELQRIAPNAFADFEIMSLPDGTEVASSPLRHRGLTSQLDVVDRGGEHLGVPVDVGLGRRRATSAPCCGTASSARRDSPGRHAESPRGRRPGRGRLAAVARRRIAEPVLDPRAEAADRPRQPVLGDRRRRPRRRTGRRARSSPSTRRRSAPRDSVARIAATDSGLPASVPPTPPQSMRSRPGIASIRVGELGGQAVAAAGHAAADRLADRHDVRVQRPRAASRRRVRPRSCASRR